MPTMIFVNLPVKDLGYMDQRSSFADPDGHLFEIIWMDPDAAPPA